jgi:hypothetical protein
LKGWLWAEAAPRKGPGGPIARVDSRAPFRHGAAFLYRAHPKRVFYGERWPSG